MALAVRIRDISLKLLNSQGKPEKVSGYQCVSCEINGVKILHTTPFSGCPGQPAPYGLDIWAGPGKKVFNLIWNPMEIICFKYGPWMNRFVPGSYIEAEIIPPPLLRSADKL